MTEPGDAQPGVLQETLQKLTSRQVITATLIVVAISLAFWILFSYRLAVILLFLGAFLGTAIRPGVDWLSSRGLPRPASVLLIFLLLIGVIVAVGMVLAPLLAEQSGNLAVRLPQIYQDLRMRWMFSPSQVIRLIGTQLPPFLSAELPSTGAAQPDPLDQVNRLINAIWQVGRIIFALVVVFLLTYYWSLESERSIRGLLLWIPGQSRNNVRALIGEIEEKVGGFVRGQAILCLAIGLAALTAYTLIGLPYALVLALLAGIFEAIPVVGPALGALPAIMIALTIDPRLVAGVLASTIIIQALENYILVPRIMKKAVGVNSIVALLSLITLSSLLGLAGALIAIPFAAIIQLLLDRFLLNRSYDSAETLPGRDYASRLHYEYQELRQDVRKVIRDKEQDPDDLHDQAEDELERLVDQLDELIARVSKVEEQA